MLASGADNTVWRIKPVLWVIFSISVGVLIVTYLEGLTIMVETWNNKPEYGHGYMIPVITLFLIWQHSDKIRQIPETGSWYGFWLVVAGSAIYVLAILSSIVTLMQYAFMISLIGLFWSYLGTRVTKLVVVPLMFLFFMIPIPFFIFSTLSSQLQLISSEIGVAVIRLFGISVYLEGNVIDLGVYQLQVVEACSGLRYLFPLVSLAFIIAYFYKAAIWKKAVVFLSSIPITILMNSFRIGVIGVLVEYGGIEQAEGFLHDFEGWVIFMACMSILFLEIWVLSKIGSDRGKSFSDTFNIEYPEPVNSDAVICDRKINAPFIVSMIMIIIVLLANEMYKQKELIIPERESFASFPMEINQWKGARSVLEKKYLDVLKLDDYIMADYINESLGVVNFYSAYYAKQEADSSPHSPSACIPGGGWRVKSHTIVPIENVTIEGVPLKVNRLVITKGEYKQVVYYWLQQRGRIITGEYYAKWYLFKDSIELHRTDGALVRLTTMLGPGEEAELADKRLISFARLVVPYLPEYLPGEKLADSEIN